MTSRRLLVAALCCCCNCVVIARAAHVGSPGGGGGSTGGAAARQTTPPNECPATCRGRSCDDWTAGNDSRIARASCAKLVRQLGCDCGGCACAASAPRRGRRRTTSGECFDTDDGAIDSYGDGCEAYVGNEDWCGGYDGTTFSSIVMCCACGGGSDTASPTPAPSVTVWPTTSFSPTDAPEQATFCGRLRALINALAAGESLVVQVMNDMSCPQEIEVEGDLSVQLFGDAAASRPALSGGGATRLFWVWFGALLELDHIALVDGWANDDGDWGDGSTRGGFLFVVDATLKLRGCVLLDGYADEVRCARAACGVGESHVGVVGRARRTRASRAGLARGGEGLLRRDERRLRARGGGWREKARARGHVPQPHC